MRSLLVVLSATAVLAGCGGVEPVGRQSDAERREALAACVEERGGFTVTPAAGPVGDAVEVLAATVTATGNTFSVLRHRDAAAARAFAEGVEDQRAVTVEGREVAAFAEAPPARMLEAVRGCLSDRSSAFA